MKVKKFLLIVFILVIVAASPLLALTDARGQGTPIKVFLPVVENNPAGSGNLGPSPVIPQGAACGTMGNPVLETFEGASSGWQALPLVVGGSVTQSNARAGVGSFSALAATNGASQVAAVRSTSFNDAASAHTWGENPGTYAWQQACVYIPSTTLSQLGADQYLSLAGIFPSAPGPEGWWLRVHQGGQLYAAGYPATPQGSPLAEFNLYARIPTDRWFELEIGLHTQAGPGVKRAFAFVVDGSFFGWYHQGNMNSEMFDRMAMGIVDTNSSGPLQVFIDQWRQPGNSQFPNGQDKRSVGTSITQDFTNQYGANWQIDWSTWANDLRLDPQNGLYSFTDRLQSGANLERMPDLTNGWAQIVYGWPQGTPPANPDGYFAAMVGFRKNINMEENMEVIPLGDGTGNVDLVFEVWVNEGPNIMGHFALPEASAIPGSHIPEPGDIIRVKWEQISPTQIKITANFFDASKNTWYRDIYNGLTIDDTAIINPANPPQNPPVNFTDGYHTMSEMTIDTKYYSIRQETVGTLATYIAP